MYAFHLLTVFCLAIPLFSVGNALKCDTTVKGLTWDFTVDEDVVIPGSPSVDACFKECAQDAKCKGYTWILDEVVLSYCYKFKHLLKGMNSCEDCTSGTIPEKIEGTCTNEIHAVEKADSVEKCMKLCSDSTGCIAYTWWHSSSIHNNACFLYENCQNVLPCDGCISASINFITPLPSQCYDYLILNEADRSTNNKIDKESTGLIFFCDSNNLDECGGFTTSQGWKGRGMYRLMEPAGIMIPESAPDAYDCGAFLPLYLNGKHPSQIGEEKDMEVCSYYYIYCYGKYNITVTNCGTFYVYLLPEVECTSRYCATSSN